MSQFKVILKDFYRFYCTRKKIKEVNDLSIWETPFFSIDNRKDRLKKLKKWIKNNEHISSFSKKQMNQNEIIIYLDQLTESILNEKKSTLAIKLFTLFNRNKYIPAILSRDFKYKTKFISLKSYCNLSSVFLNEYENTFNIQFLNTSLKINDFLMHCQISSDEQQINGSIAQYFPSYHNSFLVKYETNLLFAKNLEKELKYLEEL